MNRNTLWRLGVLLVSLCVGLTGCAKTTTTTTPPTAIAVKRYLAGGGPDTGFNGSGAAATKIDPSEFEYALAVAQQTDGKIIAAGHSALSGQGVIALVRYNANGSLDSAPGSFGSGGIVRTTVGSDGAEAVAVAVQADGKIVVAGTILAANFSGKGIVLLRYNADGTLDTSFGTPGTGIVTKTIGTGSDTAAAALALQPAVLPTDVKIIVAGHALTNTKTDIVLLRYNLDGTPDATFGGTGLVTTALSSDAAALAIQVQPADGKIVAAGSVGKFSDSSMDAVLLRYNNTDGALDATFGVGGIVQTDIGTGNNFANSIVLQPDGNIVVAGHANVNFSLDTSDVALLRYSAAGALETTFGETGQNGKVVTSLGGFDNAFSIALQPDLKIVVSGNTGSAGSVTSVAVLRYNPDGKIDTTFGTGGLVTTSATGPSTIASGNAVLVQADGSIVAAGYD